jgi:uncharacterized membrane protein YcaP (DUF421 family)
METERTRGATFGPIMNNVLLQTPEALARSVILLTGSYVGLIIVLRFTGKRTLSKMNAFDLVVTVALGSTLATIALSKDVALLQGLLVLALLVSLQFVVAWLSIRSKTFSKLVKARPVCVFKDGAFQDEALRRERVTCDEVLAAARNEGISELGSMHAIILETDGSFSVIPHAPKGKSTLEPVAGLD